MSDAVMFIGDKLREEGYYNSAKFVDWAIKKGIWQDFIANFKEQNETDIYDYLVVYNSYPEGIVNNAFDWDKTEYGKFYWGNISKEWIKHISFLKKVNKEADKTNPDYYKQKQPEPIDVIINWQLNFLEGNVIKYLARWKEKNGIEDLKKAQWYLNKLIEIEENKEEKDD